MIISDDSRKVIIRGVFIAIMFMVLFYLFLSYRMNVNLFELIARDWQILTIKQKFYLFLYPVFLIYLGVSVVVGWNILSKINLLGNFILVIPIAGVVLFLFLKIVASMFIGLFYTPFWLYKNIKLSY